MRPLEDEDRHRRRDHHVDQHQAGQAVTRPEPAERDVPRDDHRLGGRRQAEREDPEAINKID
ncbi:hypothetical protein [Actinoplanes siamensis]|uniref:hypothetical protein n=1 Tax=Actinoplanes siamensis TaxID=1223317 RepID=UPI0019449F80|nr:hypothetical protein [Actinoplanes siamensis]